MRTTDVQGAGHKGMGCSKSMKKCTVPSMKKFHTVCRSKDTRQCDSVFIFIKSKNSPTVEYSVS
jgi:hypothetical protein